LQLKYRLSAAFNWLNMISYSVGKDDKKLPLPLISPVTYSSSILFQKNNFSAEIQLKGAGKHRQVAAEFGENKIPDYVIYNFSLGYSLRFNQNELTFKTGVENLFDKQYTTYSDWNHIPQKGRNFFVNVMFGF
jgi:iron complex outermembrane receptor protein